MRAPNRKGTVATAAGLVVVGFVVASYFVPGMGMDWPEAVAEYEATQVEGERLEADLRTGDERNGFNTALVGELAAGRVGLGAAADLLLRTNADRFGYLDAVRLFNPAPTLRESTAQNLIARVVWATEADPTLQAEAVARLRGEYAALFGRPPSDRPGHPPADDPRPEVVP